jgi:hypothetical protein
VRLVYSEFIILNHDHSIIHQKPHNRIIVYRVTTTLSRTFDRREKPRLFHSRGNPQMAVAKNSKPRTNQGLSLIDWRGLADFGTFGRAAAWA